MAYNRYVEPGSCHLCLTRVVETVWDHLISASFLGAFRLFAVQVLGLMSGAQP